MTPRICELCSRPFLTGPGHPGICGACRGAGPIRVEITPDPAVDIPTARDVPGMRRSSGDRLPSPGNDGD
jgi:hypothetical protein